MELTFRWYGQDDPVTLENIRQIPGMKGVISAIYDIAVGEVWPQEKIHELKTIIEKSGLKLSGIESVPVHEDIKLGRETRDKYINAYKETLRNLAKEDIRLVCYNFMPVFDWTRSQLNYELEDGSKALIYRDEDVQRMNPLNGDLALPGWDASYTKDDLKELVQTYHNVSEEQLWENFTYFIKEVIPVAEEVKVKMAIHPDDPCWNIFGIPRIIKNKESLIRLTEIYDSPYNGLTLCAGSLGCNPDNDFVDILKYFLKRDKVNFVHARNILLTGPRSFEESAHLSEKGSLDMFEIIKAISDAGWEGPIRPDHGRMIWGETGRPGYGLYDRALGATYINGLYEAVEKIKKRGN